MSHVSSVGVGHVSSRGASRVSPLSSVSALVLMSSGFADCVASLLGGGADGGPALQVPVALLSSSALWHDQTMRVVGLDASA